MKVGRDISREEATQIIRANGWLGLPLSTVEKTFYFDGPEPPTSADVFGDKPDKRPVRLIHHWAGYGPETFTLTEREGPQ